MAIAADPDCPARRADRAAAVFSLLRQRVQTGGVRAETPEAVVVRLAHPLVIIRPGFGVWWYRRCRPATVERAARAARKSF